MRFAMLLLLPLLLLLRVAAEDAGKHEGGVGCCATWCGKSVWTWIMGVGGVETESTRMPGEVAVEGGVKKAPLEVKVVVLLG